jgi:hypothetical protein
VPLSAAVGGVGSRVSLMMAFWTWLPDGHGLCALVLVPEVGVGARRAACLQTPGSSPESGARNLQVWTQVCSRPGGTEDRDQT